jgi:acetylornithine aminotransferase
MDHILQTHEIIKTDFVRGENCHLYDQQGKQFVDFESGIWSTVLGHGYPRVIETMEAQMKRIIHLGTRYPSSLAEEAAVEILDIVGMGNGKCVFLSSGSEAVEFGAQMIRRVAGKNSLLTFSNSYLAAYGSAGKKDDNEWNLFDWSVCDAINYDESLKTISFENIGGFVFEPGGSGSGFVKFPPKRLVQDIVQRIKQNGGLVMANEVTTGMGRTGKWFGFQYYDIDPDIVSLGKGLGNGYPVSAVAVKKEAAQKLENSGFHYAQSHQNDPLGCSVAKEVINILREENWIEKGNAIGAFFLEGLKRLERNYSIVKEARGRGMLLALELHPQEGFSVTTFYHALLKEGFLVGYYPAGNVLRFDPALTIEKEDVTRILECMGSILKTAG